MLEVIHMSTTELTDLNTWVKKLPLPSFLGIYNAYLGGNRSANFRQYSLDPQESLNELQRQTNQFISSYLPQTDIEILELYTMRCFLIVARLLWLTESQQIQKARNLYIENLFRQYFATAPLTEGQIVFFIEEFENRTRNAEEGEFFDAELRIAEDHYNKAFNSPRGNSVQDFINFMEFFLITYEKDGLDAFRELNTDAFYLFYLVLLLLCKVHTYAGVIEPGAVDR